MTTLTIDQLVRENAELRRRLEEAEDALRALRAGEVDAVFVEGVREQVYTLEEPDKPYRLLVEQMPQSAATLSVNGTILYCNRRFVHLVKHPLAELVGMPLGDLFAPESRERFEALLARGLGEEVQEEFLLQRSDGASIPVVLGASALQEGPLGLCLIVTDLTERRRYRELRKSQQALRASEEALRNADRRKDEFLAVLAHELRNPLAPITSAAQILKLDDLPERERKWAQGVIERQVDVLARLVEDLLDVSRIARGRLELRRERVNLAEVIDAALETSRPLIEAGRHTCTVRLPPDPVALHADPVRLAQLFGNLLNNAAKFTERGGRITVTAECDGPEVTVSVKDSGIGIQAEVLPRIFEIFSQVRSESAGASGGLGIGLSLVKGLVELHGGTIGAASDGPGHGSEFVVRLPVDEAGTPVSSG
jgi:PAS domain S-box-containing protein